jgi:sec-independent protein translocase protein TatA
MFTPGPMELIIILVVVMVIFGPGKLPEMGAGIGKGLQGFKKAMSGKEDEEIAPSPSSSKRLIAKDDEQK